MACASALAAWACLRRSAKCSRSPGTTSHALGGTPGFPSSGWSQPRAQKRPAHSLIFCSGPADAVISHPLVQKSRQAMSIKRLMGNIGPHNGVIANEQMKPYRHGWRRASVFIATLALALNVVLGAFCVCHAEDSDSLPASICSHSGDHHADGKSHIPAGQPDDDLCCKCCGTIALNFSGAPPAFPVPVLVEWRRGPVFVVLDRVLPKSPRHIIESPRGPPLA